MNILSGCESSGTVREAFRQLGHNAISCDILPADDGSEHHIQGDVVDAIKSRRWDIVIIHPPCTALSVSGNSTYAKSKPKHHERITAIEWTMALWELAKQHAPMVCMENPVGVLPIKATQFIQPWQFGHPESKKTGLWLHNLPLLGETNNVKHIMDKLPKNKQQRLHYLPPSPERWKIRSKTFAGIASAMADQWGGGVLDESISSL